MRYLQSRLTYIYNTVYSFVLPLLPPTRKQDEANGRVNGRGGASSWLSARNCRNSSCQLPSPVAAAPLLRRGRPRRSPPRPCRRLEDLPRRFGTRVTFRESKVFPSVDARSSGTVRIGGREIDRNLRARKRTRASRRVGVDCWPVSGDLRRSVRLYLRAVVKQPVFPIGRGRYASFLAYRGSIGPREYPAPRFQDYPRNGRCSPTRRFHLRA